MIALLLMLAVGTAAPQDQRPTSGMTKCADVAIQLYKGMDDADFANLQGAFDKWVQKARKECKGSQDPEA